MKYIKFDLDKWVEVDEVRNISRIIIKSELGIQKADIEKRLSEATIPTDEEFLVWAKQNYPFTDHSAEEAELAKINEILESLK